MALWQYGNFNVKFRLWMEIECTFESILFICPINYIFLWYQYQEYQLHLSFIVGSIGFYYVQYIIETYE